MFLAIKELLQQKKKFALIITVVILVSYLVYFLTSLAYGLASSYTNAVEKWESNEIIMTVDANDNLMMSYMTSADYDTVIVNGTKSKVGLFPAVINNPTAADVLSTRLDVYFFGIENDSFIKPVEYKNTNLTGYQVIVDESLQKSGYKIGDKFGVTGTTDQFEIIGFTSKSTYQTAPVIYMALDTYQAYRFGKENTPDLFSGVVVRGEVMSLKDGLQTYLTKDYISTLPGYTAQVLTFGVMIAFLIFIVALVLGIFIYVLTIQKTSMFGVMKAQGISNRYIGGSVIFQTVALVLIGIVVGLALTLISGYFLKEVMPFAINITFYSVITLAFFIFAIFGGLFSVKAVLKIDPLRAIGG
ncbi:ABC transporter permease [Acholeplasma hippikon]|uniref:FtsX-like permease family n=1 Tax=Acholeplasma hippikon TaxID=264636 RepID=A0A449BI10_9MOLU|nr:ABC transporter permease [Acholeplasma hippikon]VEU82086.1 FtsX-like permease family [Acholeplasma hippikon]